MRLDFGLQIEQSQKLIMTPELRQAIKVLQMSSIELTQYIDQELQENPVLELTDDGAEGGTSGEKEAEEPQGDENNYDIDWQEYFNDSSDLGYPAVPREVKSQEYGFEAFTAKAPSLAEHLNLQLVISNCPKELSDIVEYLIHSLDNNGYLNESIDGISQEMEVAQEQILRALEVVQSFEPIGVGARTLDECLLLQVKHLNLDDSLLQEIIKNHLSELAQGRLDKIAAKLQVSVKTVQETADKLKILDPKPGRQFSGPNDTRYIVPDLVVEKIDNEYIILVNDITAPRIKVSNFYRRTVQKNDPQVTGEARKYVESKLNSAMWLVRSIEQRRLTLYRVANELVKRQKEFLDCGVKHLKPLSLKDIASELELHESTVSRATANKYMQTPRGVFEMKYFFSTGIKSKGGEQVSATSIKKLLQEIIAGEDSKRPYSDQKIANLLAEQGFKISRRTVNKYREELQIPSAGKRKRY
ncbi:MAG: RNA polymerase factor sigma-54 [Firmicutes bacterium]|nr:RNA polymerase factor sigma-54 [Bacillota bacterium]